MRFVAVEQPMMSGTPTEIIDLHAAYAGTATPRPAVLCVGPSNARMRALAALLNTSPAALDTIATRKP